MLRKRLFAALTLLAAGSASQALAGACEFKSTVLLGETQEVVVQECWDLTGWSAAKVQEFCRPGVQGETEVKLLAACPAAQSTGQCKAKVQAPKASKLPEAYFAQMPKEVADQIKARMAEANPLSAFDGLPTTIHYYAPTPPQTVADQRTDCVEYKKGAYTPRP